MALSSSSGGPVEPPAAKKKRPGRPGRPGRKVEREVAFQILYSLNFSSETDETRLRSVFASSPDLEARGLSSAPEGFAWELVCGVWLNRAGIDEAIARYSQNWRVERMGLIELTILRIGMYEVLFVPAALDVPVKVALNEAVELAKNFGDENSRGFVNGILDAAARALEAGKERHRGQA